MSYTSRSGLPDGQLQLSRLTTLSTSRTDNPSPCGYRIFARFRSSRTACGGSFAASHGRAGRSVRCNLRHRGPQRGSRTKSARKNRRGTTDGRLCAAVPGRSRPSSAHRRNRTRTQVGARSILAGGREQAADWCVRLRVPFAGDTRIAVCSCSGFPRASSSSQFFPAAVGVPSPRQLSGDEVAEVVVAVGRRRARSRPKSR